MKQRRLQTRFILAGCLLAVATVGSSAWSALTFVRLNTVVDNTLRESQETIDFSAELHSSLEREDDALLLFLSGDVEKSQRNLAAERRRGDDGFERLLSRLRDGEDDEQEMAAALRQQIDRYRTAGDELLLQDDRTSGLDRYHRQVNPLLRQAVAGCDKLREANFRSMQQAGIRARDEAARGTQLVTVISVLTVVLGIGVAVWLASSILGPVRELTDTVEAIRQGDFDRRVGHASADELGQLAGGFNRMAEALSEYRRSSLGEVLAAKSTLEATLNALPDAVIVFGPNGDIVAKNPPAIALLRAKLAENVSRLAEIPLSEDYREAVLAVLTGTSARTRRFDFQQTLNAVFDGQARRFLLTVVPIPDFTPGRFAAAVVLDDVTDFARLDELRSELIGVASHELKSPLTSLRMNLLMLGERADQMTPRQQQLITAAIEGCEELRLTIEELLDVTRIEAGQLRLNVGPVVLGSILMTVQKAMQMRFDDACVKLIVEVFPVPIIVPADPVRLRSVLANVLTNALKYSPSGSVVTVRLSSGQNAQVRDTRYVQITVTDEGPGVPAEFRERVFEKFFRVENHVGQRSEGIRGTGIGLYLCREIMKAHGGTIICEAGDGTIGTRIAIALPLSQ